MPLTTLDSRTALIVVDLQNGVVRLPTVHPADEIAKQAARLADAFRERGLPVVLVTATGVAPGRNELPRRTSSQRPPADSGDLAAQLGPQPGDHLVHKQVWGAFHDPALAEWLRARDVTQVVVTGIATSMGVESTARGAHEYGFHVTVATDAVTDLQQEDHDHAIRRVFPKIAETGTTDDVLALLPSTQI